MQIREDLDIEVARPEGFEPPTNRIGTCYSIQLSYGRTSSEEAAILLRTGGCGKRQHSTAR